MAIPFPEYTACRARLRELGIKMQCAHAPGANIFWLSRVPMSQYTYTDMSQAEVLRYATTVQGPALP